LHFLSAWLAVAAAAAPAASQPARALGDTGGGYWQQRVRYEIRARLDEPTGVLAGTERVLYVNQSPDTLRQFYMHLYLNAFRPHSRWADRDSIEGRFRFNHLKDPDFGFNHVTDVTFDGTPEVAEYPYAPDSTIVHFALPRPLAPGDSMVVAMRWDARPSTVPRRQGRQGRRFDFAEWYPRVTAYDRYGWEPNPLQPAGEFYGEFGSFDVTLDLAADQVIGATGVPIEGDPGWEHAKADPTTVVDYQRHWYGDSLPGPIRGPGVGGDETVAGCRSMSVGPGRKCVRFYADHVHHFAMSLNPQYIYEQGRYHDVVVHVLYQPQDTATWGHGIAVHREEIALQWLDELFGTFAYPQITNVHRIEGGGTEFPMMVMNGGDSQGLILHESGHNYLMAILANNEWKEGYLDEGFTSFQTSWYWETHRPGYDDYHPQEAFILGLDLDGWSQPVSTPGHMFRDFNTYNVMTYTKGELFYDELRYIVGADTMHEILEEYYRRWKLKHVDERALLETAEDVSRTDLKPLFAQWLHTTDLYDYALGWVHRRHLADGSWETSVQIQRKADGVLPVEVGEASAANRGVVIYGRVDGRAAMDTLTFHTKQRPGTLMLDPRVMTHDWNFTNNYEHHLFSTAGRSFRFDDYVSDAAARDHVIESIAPSVWYNDAGGVTVGVRERSNYLGRFNESTAWLQYGVAGWDSARKAPADKRIGFALSLANPTWLRRAQHGQAFDAWYREGTAGARITLTHDHPVAWFRRDDFRTAWTLQWVATPTIGYLDPTRWQDAGTAELTRAYDWDLPDGPTKTRIRMAFTGGVAYTQPGTGVQLANRYDVEPFGRATASAAFRRAMGGLDVGVRFFAGGYVAQNAPLRQRAIPIAGADPYQTLGNPFVRSAGALFVRPNVYYHSPGNGDLRGYAGNLGGRWIGAMTLEVAKPLFEASPRSRGPVRAFSLVAFGDGAVVDSMAVPGAVRSAAAALYDAGAGLRVGLRVGAITFPLRIELPLLVSRPAYAQDTHPGNDVFGFRWLFSVEPSF